MANVPIIKFNAGELSEQIDARFDIDKYSAGCRVLENFIPRIYGTAERRPGTCYVCEVKDSDVKGKLFSFIYSSSIAYIVEFGNLSARFYYNSGLIVGSLLADTDAWADATAYIVGDFVSYDSVIYRCIEAHTSSSGGGDDAGGEPDTNPTQWTAATLTSDNYPIYEIITPYLEADLYELHVKQRGDVMWIVHPEYAPRKLSRLSATSFDLSAITFSGGPFLMRNDLLNDDDVTMTSDVTAVDGTGELTASSATFEEGHVGALFKLVHPRPTSDGTSVTKVTISKTATSTGTSDAIDIKGGFRVYSHGTWTGTVILQRNEDSAGWESFRTWDAVDDTRIQYTGNESEDNVQYRINVSSLTSGTVSVDITVDDSTMTGIVEVTGYTNTTHVDITVINAVASTDATKRWAEGAWSDVQGWPYSMTFFEERAIFVGMSLNVVTVWLSEIGDYEDFEEGVVDDDSFNLIIPSTNDVRWVESLEALLIGTSGDEWKVVSNKLDTALTATNYTVRQQCSYGSNLVQPLKVNDVILFIDFVGRKVRELVYRDVPESKYVAPDLTAVAEHITYSGITSMAHQRNPDSILWGTLNDGSLIAMTYERNQNVVAWAKYPIGGTDVIVDCEAVIPGSSEDQVWFIVERTIDESTVKYVEYMNTRSY